MDSDTLKLQIGKANQRLAELTVTYLRARELDSTPKSFLEGLRKSILDWEQHITDLESDLKLFELREGLNAR